MLKIRFAVVSLVVAAMLPLMPTLRAQAPAAPIPTQILTAKKVFISNAGGLFDLNMVSGDPRRGYNQFYSAIQSWKYYELVGTPAEADLVLQISLISIPRQIGTEIVPFPSFRLALLDPKTNIELWVMDEFLVDRPGFSMIREKNRDKAFDVAIGKLIADLKALTVPPAATGNPK